MASLWEALKQYVSDAAPGGVLNTEQPKKLASLLDVGKQRANYIGGLLDTNSQISQDAQNWHKRTQIGLADQLAGRETPEAEAAYQSMMQAAGVAPVGMIAWHGSPHKFDKFSLDKIGTGEGAQAYGHGLYLAESPEVAKSYQQALSANHVLVDGKDVQKIKGTSAYSGMDAAVKALGMDKAEATDAAQVIRDYVRNNGDWSKVRESYADMSDYFKPKMLSLVDKLEPRVSHRFTGSLYKTDIPDEAVARFLDWDKPLSQQAPEVQAALHGSRKNLMSQADLARYDELLPKASDPFGGMTAAEFREFDSLANKMQFNEVYGSQDTGEAIYKLLASRQADASNYLKQQGIPGIRYLDGGSRSAGQGSSNFVAFDPEMIRILERNGQPTGLQPWKPGEWKP